jgi:hypothetical protein
MKQPPHLPILAWFVLIGLVIFGAFVSLDQGLVSAMVAADRSHICVVLVVMYVIGAGHSFFHTLNMSRELESATALRALLTENPGRSLRVVNRRLELDGGQRLPAGLVSDYLSEVAIGMQNAVTGGDGGELRSNLLDAHAAPMRGATDFGWYYADLMLKVGFLGTLVGFILMLSSVADTATIDSTTMQRVMTQMSYGMSTALYTTLASLVAGILLSIPYHLLERFLDQLLETAVHLGEVELGPRLAAPTSGSFTPAAA